MGKIEQDMCISASPISSGSTLSETKMTDYISTTKRLSSVNGYARTRIAAALHAQWVEGRRQADGTFEPRIKVVEGVEYDIANLPFGRLPEKFQTANLQAARFALRHIEVTHAQGHDIASAECPSGCIAACTLNCIDVVSSLATRNVHRGWHQCVALSLCECSNPVRSSLKYLPLIWVQSICCFLQLCFCEDHWCTLFDVAKSSGKLSHCLLASRSDFIQNVLGDLSRLWVDWVGSETTDAGGVDAAEVYAVGHSWLCIPMSH